MRPRRLPAALAVLAFLSAGCNPSSTDAAKPAPAPTPRPSIQPTQQLLAPLPHAQPKLPTIKLKVGPVLLETEVASEPVQIMTGMMYRESMADTEGMIFILPGSPRKASFWMRNTKVALSAAYIDCAGRIREIHDLNPFDENPAESATDQICYVLEVPQGWFIRKRIAVGESVMLENGPLSETFRKK